MPGTRNFAKERATHTPAAKQADLYQLLTAQLPHLDRALAGWPAILEHLARLQIHRRNGGPLTHRIVQAWAHDHGFPLLRGNRHGQCRCPPLSTSHAITAWILSQFNTDGLFRVGDFTPVPHRIRHAA